MTLSFFDFQSAAREIDVDPCFIAAVADVESGNSGFEPDGRARIRFERHVMARELKQRGASANYITAAAKFSGVSWETLTAALALDKEAALCSASWGVFQIMGFNFRLAGFESVHAFVLAHKESEQRQLTAFCGFVRSAGMLPAMKSRDFISFAFRYNGPGYARHQYDKKLLRAYQRSKAEQSEARP